MNEEKRYELLEKDGTVRIRFIVQCTIIKRQPYITSLSLATMPPREFTEEDCAWIAKTLREHLLSEI
jgi:hypothetical protein